MHWKAMENNRNECLGFYIDHNFILLNNVFIGVWMQFTLVGFKILSFTSDRIILDQKIWDWMNLLKPYGKYTLTNV